ncbi:MAG: hypothetical protein V1808_04345 [Candidatus Daviesbacteria bacterium]
MSVYIEGKGTEASGVEVFNTRSNNSEIFNLIQDGKNIELDLEGVLNLAWYALTNPFYNEDKPDPRLPFIEKVANLHIFPGHRGSFLKRFQYLPFDTTKVII